MRELNAQQVRDIARGAAVLGTGGGGDPYLGTLSALQALEEFGSPTVIEPDEVPDDGARRLAVHRRRAGRVPREVPDRPRAASTPTTRSIAIWTDGLVALMSAEMGGANSIVPLILGARLGVPVVDADGMGRAYPEVQLVTMTLYGIKACPFSIVDEHGNSAVINAIDNTWTERMARPLAVEFGAISTGDGLSDDRRAAPRGRRPRHALLGRAHRRRDPRGARGEGRPDRRAARARRAASSSSAARSSTSQRRDRARLDPRRMRSRGPRRLLRGAR